MSAIKVLTINAELESEEELVKIVEGARKYFPSETWNNIQYVGELSLKHEFQIALNEKSFGALFFEKLLNKLERIKGANRLVNLLLGITPDPIVAFYYFFDGKNFKKSFYFIHDYVAEKTGVVSLFQVDEEMSSKVVAHGLGHNRGLRHHAEPIDFMYSGLLKSPRLKVDGFCKICIRKLTEAPPET
ncbi:MAG: hypothetical protein ACLFU9_06370 [Candidatus Bathyarchaeia archaeon]